MDRDTLLNLRRRALRSKVGADMLTKQLHATMLVEEVLKATAEMHEEGEPYFGALKPREQQVAK